MADDPAAALPHARLAAEHAEDATPGASDPRAAAEFELGSALLDLGRAASPEAAEGIASFKERRKPGWAPT